MKKTESYKSQYSLIKIASTLFPIYRCLVGPGVFKTLNFLKNIHSELIIRKIKSGTNVFDWKVPYEWHVKKAYIKDLRGKKIIDIQDNNLHLVGYSTPQNKIISLKKLQNHLHSLPNQPNAIPYVTSYYNKNWGFCLKHKDRQNIKDNFYKVVIDSKFKRGHLRYGEIFFKGSSKKEIFFSTYICHPSMANNEISGPTIAIKLAEYLKNIDLRYSYRIIFIPETIGSIVYISKNLKNMKNNILAGFNLTCLGDRGDFSIVPSRCNNTISDRIIFKTLQKYKYNYKQYSWLDRGSDERQFCSPGVDLPIVTISRSKFAEYPEYHTSLDNMSLISQKDLKKSFTFIKRVVQEIEKKTFYMSAFKCEPQLSKRMLYPTVSRKDNFYKVENMMNVLSYCDGKNDIQEISKKSKVSLQKCANILNILNKEGLIFSL